MAKLRAGTLYRGQVLRLTLNAPPGNPLDEELVEELHAALPSRPGDLKLILLAAEGPDFSVGGRLESPRYHELFFRLIDLGLPTVAMVRGRCLGSALELAAFCNFIFAEGTASFGQPEVRRGGLPTPASVILPLKLGSERATDLVLTGVTVDAAEAYRRGMVTAWVRQAHDLDALVKAWIEQHLLPKSARSLRLANRVARLSFHAQLRAELPALERLYLSAVA